MSDFNYATYIPVLDGIRAALEKFKHYKEFTQRVKPMLQEHLPGYTVWVEVDKKLSFSTSYHIGVWGKDIPYDKKMYLVWSDMSDSQPRPWVDGLLNAIAVADPRDWLERQEQERALYPAFALINSEVEALIRKAQSMIKNLPIPSCATVRNDHPSWRNASDPLRKTFPLLFDTDLPTKENE
jgi:hypothetical protein